MPRPAFPPRGGARRFARTPPPFGTHAQLGAVRLHGSQATDGHGSHVSAGHMSKPPKHAARIDNTDFPWRVGLSLRWATQDIAREDLPANIKQLLARLERLETRARVKGAPPDESPAG